MIQAEDETALGDEDPFLAIRQDVFTIVPNTEILDLDFIKEPIAPFVSFMLEFCRIIGVKYNKKAYIPTSTEFFTMLFTNQDHRRRFVSVGKPNAHFIVDSRVVLI